MDLCILNPVVSSKRINFVMPLTWLRKGLGPVGIDFMASQSLFICLIIALLSDPFWYTSEKPDSTLRQLKPFDAAVVVGKIILNTVYNLRGELNTKFLLSNLNVRINDFGEGLRIDRTSLSIDFFTGSRLPDQPNFGAQKSVTIWQCIRAIVTSNILSFLEKDGKKLENNFSEEDYESFQVPSDAMPKTLIDMPIFHMESLAKLLRSAMCVTGLIQRMHISFMLTNGRLAPPKYSGFTRSMDGLGGIGVKGRAQPKMGSPKCNQIWTNYLFDIAAMWMVARRFHEAVTPDLRENGQMFSTFKRDLVHAGGKARLWSLTTGLSGSARTLAMSLKYHSLDVTLINQIGVAANVLHWLYLRIWNHLLPALQESGYNGELGLMRAVARLSSQVFVKSDETIKVDKPDCGTATLIDNSWTFTMLGPETLGLVGTSGSSLIGTAPEDLNYSFYVGFVSVAVTQSTEHLWVSVRHPQSWVGQIDHGLPLLKSFDDLQKFCDDASWCPTYEDLNEEYTLFRKSHWRNHEAEQQRDIDAILSRM